MAEGTPAGSRASRVVAPSSSKIARASSAAAPADASAGEEDGVLEQGEPQLEADAELAEA